MLNISVLPKSQMDSCQHISSFVSLALPPISSGTRHNQFPQRGANSLIVWLNQTIKTNKQKNIFFFFVGIFTRQFWWAMTSRLDDKAPHFFASDRSQRTQNILEPRLIATNSNIKKGPKRNAWLRILISLNLWLLKFRFDCVFPVSAFRLSSLLVARLQSTILHSTPNIQ